MNALKTSEPIGRKPGQLDGCRKTGLTHAGVAWVCRKCGLEACTQCAQQHGICLSKREFTCWECAR